MTTGKTAATPAIAMAFGSWLPDMYTAKEAAKNDRAHEAASAFACVIFCPFGLVFLELAERQFLDIRPRKEQA
jgi:hypothetical protein